MSEATAEKTTSKVAVEVRAEGRVGTICRTGPCVLCDRLFDERGGQTRLIARDRHGKRLGLVCNRCASTDQDALKEQLLSKAKRLKQKAQKLERWIENGIKIHPSATRAAPEAATARTTRRGIL